MRQFLSNGRILTQTDKILVLTLLVNLFLLTLFVAICKNHYVLLTVGGGNFVMCFVGSIEDKLHDVHHHGCQDLVRCDNSQVTK